MGEKALRKRLVNAAWANETLRPHVLPLLTTFNIPGQNICVRGTEKQARKLMGRILNAANFCTTNSGLCKENLGLKRSKMPVIEPDDLDKFIERLRAGSLDTRNPPKTGEAKAGYFTSGDKDKDKTKVKVGKTPAADLKATQKEIHTDKAEGMAESSRKGDFVPWEAPILVSADNFILDGHHRWAATLLIDPQKSMNTFKVDLPIEKLLEVANAYTDALGNKRKASAKEVL